MQPMVAYLEEARQHEGAGRPEQAEALCRQVLQIQPDNAEALHLLGRIATKLGRPGIAVALLRKATAKEPCVPAFHNSLGAALLDLGRSGEAIESLDRALALDPGHVKALRNLGIALLARGKPMEAAARFRAALAYEPAHTDTLSNLGAALLAVGLPDEAAASFRAALAHEPTHAGTLSNLGVALLAVGLPDEAAASFRQAAAGKGEADAHSNVLFALQYSPSCDLATLSREARSWDARHAASVPAVLATEPSADGPAGPRTWPTADPDRRLHIGYVSPDLRHHPVGLFLQAALSHRAAEQVEVFCYTTNTRADEVTSRLRACADEWRSLAGVPDREAAEMIRADDIDVSRCGGP